MRPRDGIPPTPRHLKAAEGPEQEGQDLTGVLFKLGAFTAAMVILPITSYYVSRDYYWKENTTGAGMTAATVANVVLVLFIYVAIKEDVQANKALQAKKKR